MFEKCYLMVFPIILKGYFVPNLPLVYQFKVLTANINIHLHVLFF